MLIVMMASALAMHKSAVMVVWVCPERQGNLVGSLVREGNDREAHIRGDSKI